MALDQQTVIVISVIALIILFFFIAHVNGNLNNLLQTNRQIQESYYKASQKLEDLKRSRSYEGTSSPFIYEVRHKVAP